MSWLGFDKTKRHAAAAIDVVEDYRRRIRAAQITIQFEQGILNRQSYHCPSRACHESEPGGDPRTSLVGARSRVHLGGGC